MLNINYYTSAKNPRLRKQRTAYKRGTGSPKATPHDDTLLDIFLSDYTGAVSLLMKTIAVLLI